jgi:hypothetical protein
VAEQFGINRRWSHCGKTHQAVAGIYLNSLYPRNGSAH